MKQQQQQTSEIDKTGALRLYKEKEGEREVKFSKRGKGGGMLRYASTFTQLLTIEF